MNVDTDLKIEQTTYPNTGQTEYRIKMRKVSKRFNFAKLTFETIEQWVEHPRVEDEQEWPIWNDSSKVFYELPDAERSLAKLQNYYLRKESIKTIL